MPRPTWTRLWRRSSHKEEFKNDIFTAKYHERHHPANTTGQQQPEQPLMDNLGQPDLIRVSGLPQHSIYPMSWKITPPFSNPSLQYWRQPLMQTVAIFPQGSQIQYLHKGHRFTCCKYTGWTEPIASRPNPSTTSALPTSSTTL
jgi:hypothetical protein